MHNAARIADSAVPAALVKAQWQGIIFAPRPKRMELQALKPSWPCREITVAVHRNQPFEFVEQAMPAFLAYADLDARFVHSDYDDSLQFGGGDADIHLVWLDFETYRDRLNPAELSAWLFGRVAELRAASSAPILIANWAARDAAADAFNALADEAASAMPAVRLYDRRPLMDAMGEGYWDARLKAVGATSLSGPATVAVARELALRWFPAALRPRLKCLALDLDNTLYSGVLGEDGVGGVVLTAEHEALQARLLELRDQGFFLAAVSKNEAEDVERLLAERDDFPLRREHFSATAVSWGGKADGLEAIAATLRIGTDAVMFVDDNLGEIAEVATRFPAMRCVHSADPTLALAELELGPDLLAWRSGEEDRLRAGDLAADAQRQAAMAQARDPHAYLASLATRIDFHLDAADHVARVHELSNKTNQFNLALKRLSETEVAAWAADPTSHAVTFRLSDRLSDSGIIGMMLMRREGDAMIVEELCISCRALGRKLEDLMIAGAIAKVAGAEPIRQVAFAHATGPRNGPARTWLAAFAGADIGEESGYCRLEWPRPSLAERLQALPVEIAWH